MAPGAFPVFLNKPNKFISLTQCRLAEKCDAGVAEVFSSLWAVGYEVALRCGGREIDRPPDNTAMHFGGIARPAVRTVRQPGFFNAGYLFFDAGVHAFNPLQSRLINS